MGGTARTTTTVNGIAENKRAPTLLLVYGMNHYSLIRGMVSPAKPEEKTLKELCDLLKGHFDPEPVVIAERFQFYQRSQGSGESVSEFLASLRKLASRCQFGTFLSEVLRDRLVCGLSSEAIQKALLAKQDLTLDTEDLHWRSHTSEGCHHCGCVLWREDLLKHGVSRRARRWHMSPRS